VSWNLGDKLQVRTDGFTTRTYTPIGWDPVAGSTTLLAYMHGDGPGSTWARTVEPGDTCDLLGPRQSLKFDDPGRPVLFVGDETSFGLATAWQRAHPTATAIASLFEVNDPDEANVALTSLAFASARLFRRQEDADHIDELTRMLIEVLQSDGDPHLCLTGKAQTIAAIRRALKEAGLSNHSTNVKAYWDAHRAGLD
jgi:NADPH-dependent ferric siderophore reductase